MGRTSKRQVPLNRDLFGGPLMMMVGLAFAYFGQDYQLGTMRQMGPGFMPVALGVILALIGLLILIGGIAVAAADHEAFQWPDWRGLSAIVLGVLSFVFLSERAGLMASTFAVVFISALGDRHNRPRDALMLAAGMTIVGVAVFYYGLQIRLPLLPEAQP